DFRKDLADYLNGCGGKLFSDSPWRPLGPRLVKRFQRLRQLHLHKWGITRLPNADLWPEADYAITSDRLDRWYQRQRDEDPAFTTRSYPVFMARVRRGENLSRMLIELDVDTGMPIDS